MQLAVMSRAKRYNFLGKVKGTLLLDWLFRRVLIAWSVDMFMIVCACSLQGSFCFVWFW